MSFHGGADGVGKTFFVGIVSHLEQEGNVVFIAGFVHPAFQINAELRLGQRRGEDRLGFLRLRLRRTSHTPALYQRVFNVQNTHAALKLRHVRAIAEFLLQRDHELDAGDRGEAHVGQLCCRAEVPAAHKLRADIQKLLLQGSHFPG